MTQDGKPLVDLSGTIDFTRQRDSITLSPSAGQKSYPPYEVRYVDGWSYIQIDTGAVRRPPSLRSGTRWIAFHQLPSVIPVPDRAMPPGVPIDVMNLPLTQPMVNAHYVDPPGTTPRRVSVRFSRGPYSVLGLTYSIDTTGHIAAVSSLDVARGGGGGNTLTFAYGPDTTNIVAPSTGVQTLKPGENLYPVPTTAPSS
ncbi:MAG: hypothetical protein QOE62_3391 [Actinomycetota bacterium]|jgi:hypothetical protein|nr:hypothetical protein [Actinomycetota bacterium]